MSFKTGPNKTKGGFDVIVFTLKAKGSYPVVGIVRHKSADEPTSWTAEGRFDKSKDETPWDLVQEPQ